MKAGNFRDTRHATDRRNERRISREEVLYVLKHGHHEKKKDKHDSFYQAWNYAIRGKTVDRRELRIVISCNPQGLWIITAMTV